MTNAIEAAGLTKAFGEVMAVDHLDLTVPAGQVLALLGPNGAGKSTATEMILGFVRPDAGRVRVFGLEPSHAVAHGHVGAMLQQGSLWNGMPVRTMLSSMRGMYAHPLALDEVIARSGVESFLGTKVEKLSGGQAQRVRFALALMADPELILLDEPTAGLDVDARRRFWATMRDFAGQGRTVLFATHYLEEADEFADRIVVMSKGSVIADGTGEQIKARVAQRHVSFASDVPQAWDRLPGVAAVTTRGPRIVLTCTDSDACLRALVMHDAHDIEVSTVSLEDAFLQLTHAA